MESVQLNSGKLSHLAAVTLPATGWKPVQCRRLEVGVGYRLDDFYKPCGIPLTRHEFGRTILSQRRPGLILPNTIE
jgi:hypothetical protein